MKCITPKDSKGRFQKGYKYPKNWSQKRIRPKGLKYKIKQINKGWFKKGDLSTMESLIKWRENGGQPWNKGLKGIHLSPKSEFKYKNGNGYRNLLYKKILKQICKDCGFQGNLKRLHVHHLDKNRQNNSISNLMVLCRPCHLQRHGKQELNYVEGRKRL